MVYLTILVGLVLLGLGGEGVVRGGARLAQKLRVPRLLITMVVVAFATSTPELAVSLTSAIDGKPELALGNIIGSNIANILFVLALPALVYPLGSNDVKVMREAVVMLAATVFFMWMLTDRSFSRLDGIILTISLLIIIAVFYVLEKRAAGRESVGKPSSASAARSELSGNKEQEEPHKPLDPRLDLVLSLAFVAGGIAALVFGADFIVRGATDLGHRFGITERVIGLTVLAAGTSLPELAAVAAAAVRRQADVAIGGIVGSNIFNLLAVTGLTALVAPLSVDPEFVKSDMWVLLAASLAVIPFLTSDWRLGRVEGVCMLAGYVAFVTHVFGIWSYFP